MAGKEISDSYVRLKKKHKLYKKATRRSEFILRLGLVIFILSLFEVPKWILGNALGTVIDDIQIGGLLFGFLLLFIGTKISQRTKKTIDFSITEEKFLEVYEALQDIETYQKDKISFSRIEAVKKLSKVERKIDEPSLESSSFWASLNKEEIENLRILKWNIKEILLPNITQGNEEDVKKAQIIVVKFGQYILNPTFLKLEGLNKSMAELTIYSQETNRLIPLLDHPYMRHGAFIILFAVAGFISVYLGTQVGVSIDTSYTVGIGLFGTLTVGYMLFILKKS